MDKIRDRKNFKKRDFNTDNLVSAMDLQKPSKEYVRQPELVLPDVKRFK